MSSNHQDNSIHSDLRPFWSPITQIISSHTWLPESSLSVFNSHSWFSCFFCFESQNLYFDPSKLSNLLDYKTENSNFKTKKIQIFPSPVQEKSIKNFFGAARFTYNQALNLFRDNIARTKKSLRKKCVNDNAYPDLSMKWLYETPYQIRDEAMNDLYQAYILGLKMHKAGKISNFNLKHRSKNDPSQSIKIVYRNIKRISNREFRCFPTRLPGNIKCAEDIPAIIHDCRLQWYPKINEFYICIPIDITTIDPQIPDVPRVIALDPGVRTFMTGYDPTGFIFKWGHKDLGRIYRLCDHLDAILSVIGRRNRDINHRRRNKLRRITYRLRKKIRNLIDDVQKKLVNFLCKNWNFILLPKFGTSGMVKKGERRINKRSVRGMLGWGHYRFQQRLIAKAREYEGCRVKIVDEAYTSKTCGRCGEINHNLGGNKVFRCKDCRLEIDRDINGARNIYLRVLSTI